VTEPLTNCHTYTLEAEHQLYIRHQSIQAKERCENVGELVE